MSEEKFEKYNESVKKHNADCESIINGTWDVIEGKDSVATVRSLVAVLVTVIGSNFEAKEEKDRIVSYLIKAFKFPLKTKKSKPALN
jgi:hypothetical protein